MFLHQASAQRTAAKSWGWPRCLCQLMWRFGMISVWPGETGKASRTTKPRVLEVAILASGSEQNGQGR